MRFVIIGLLVFLFASCDFSNNENSSGKSVVSGEIINMTEDFILYQIADKLQSDYDTAWLTEQNEFSLNFDLDQPEYLNLKVNNSNLVLYIKPNDSLNIAANANSFFKSIRIKARYSGVYNDYLLSFIRNKYNSEEIIYRIFSSPEHIATKMIDSLKNVQNEKFESFKNGFGRIDEKFLFFENQRILYEWAYNRCVYPKYFKYLNKQFQFESSAEYSSFLSELEINNEKLLHLDIYKLFLKEYLEKETSDAYRIKTQDSSFEKSYLEFQLSQIDKLFSDTAVINYLSYSLFYNHVKYDGIKDYNELFPLFTDLCQNDFYISEINKELEKWTHLHKGMPAEDFEFTDIKGKPYNLSDFKGKYLYVDIWATWCSPCLDEIPYIESLKNQLANSNVEIISVSVDADKSKWEKFLFENKITHNQYYIGKSSVLKDFYKISGIPRFMIIDKNSKIYSASADRPSMGVYEELKKLSGS